MDSVRWDDVNSIFLETFDVGESCPITPKGIDPCLPCISGALWLTGRLDSVRRSCGWLEGSGGVIIACKENGIYMGSNRLYIIAIR